jgi:trehalose/maltose hydrolase-like predicted phosphorylase
LKVRQLGAGARPRETQSQVAGFYAHVPGQFERRAGVPTWSTLGFSDGSATFGDVPRAGARLGRIVRYRQSLDLRDGVLSTTITWRSPVGRVTDLTFAVFADRARAHVAAVRMSITPHWSGTATITDVLDGQGAHLTTPHPPTVDSTRHELRETVIALGTHDTAIEVSRLELPRPSQRTTRIAVPGDPGSVAQTASLAVVADHTYSVTKYVGIATSVGTDRAGDRALSPLRTTAPAAAP